MTKPNPPRKAHAPSDGLHYSLIVESRDHDQIIALACTNNMSVSAQYRVAIAAWLASRPEVTP